MTPPHPLAYGLLLNEGDSTSKTLSPLNSDPQLSALKNILL